MPSVDIWGFTPCAYAWGMKIHCYHNCEVMVALGNDQN